MRKIRKIFQFNNILWVLFYLFIFVILLNHSFSYFDNDFAWHLKVGQEISYNHLIPHHNLYNYTFQGNWVDHEWLSNVLLYKVYNLVGYTGINIIFSLLIIVTLVLLTYYLKYRLKKVPNLLIISVQIFGVLASIVSLGVRIQELAILFLLLLLISLYLYQKKNKIIYIAYLPLLFYLWANMHASFLMGLGVLLVYIIIQIIQRIIYRKKFFSWVDFSVVLNKLQIINLSIAFLISFSFTLLTPYKLELYSFLSGYSNTFYLSHIREWLSQFSYPFNYWQLLYLAFVFSFLVLYLINIFYYRKKRMNLWETVLVLIFSFFAFRSRRNFPLFFIVSFVFVIENIVSFFELKTNTWPKFNKLYRLFIVLCLLFSSLGIFLTINFVKNPFNYYCQDFPCQATQVLKEQTLIQDNLFNDYDWGGYLIWVYPERKLFIDGRLPQVEFAGKTFLEEYLLFFKKDSDIDAKLNQYNINVVLLKNTDKKFKVKKWEKFLFGIKTDEYKESNNLREYLKQSNKWNVLYQDKTAIIFKRK